MNEIIRNLLSKMKVSSSALDVLSVEEDLDVKQAILSHEIEKDVTDLNELLSLDDSLSRDTSDRIESLKMKVSRLQQK